MKLINKIYRQGTRYMIADMFGDRHGPYISFEQAKAVLELKNIDYYKNQKRNCKNNDSRTN
jgi:hypothetical protein